MRKLGEFSVPNIGKFRKEKRQALFMACVLGLAYCVSLFFKMKDGDTDLGMAMIWTMIPLIFFVQYAAARTKVEILEELLDKGKYAVEITEAEPGKKLP